MCRASYRSQCREAGCLIERSLGPHCSFRQGVILARCRLTHRLHTVTHLSQVPRLL